MKKYMIIKLMLFIALVYGVTHVSGHIDGDGAESKVEAVLPDCENYVTHNKYLRELLPHIDKLVFKFDQRNALETKDAVGLDRLRVEASQVLDCKQVPEMYTTITRFAKRLQIKSKIIVRITTAQSFGQFSATKDLGTGACFITIGIDPADQHDTIVAALLGMNANERNFECTLAHELGHIMLGHLDYNDTIGSHFDQEYEADLVAGVVINPDSVIERFVPVIEYLKSELAAGLCREDREDKEASFDRYVIDGKDTHEAREETQEDGSPLHRHPSFTARVENIDKWAARIKNNPEIVLAELANKNGASYIPVGRPVVCSRVFSRVRASRCGTFFRGFYFVITYCCRKTHEA